MTYFKAVSSTLLLLLLIPAAASAGTVQIDTPEDTYEKPDIPIMPAAIAPEMPEVASLSQSQGYQRLSSLNQNLAKKSKCVRKKKKCRVSETQLETWAEDISDYSDEISDTINENFDDRYNGQVDALREPQGLRAAEAQDARDQYMDQIDADLEADRSAINDYKEEQSSDINDAYQSLVDGEDATWNGQVVSFNQLNVNTCTEANPDPENKLDPNDPGKKWDNACDQKRDELATIKAAQPDKKNKKAFKKWQAAYKKKAAEVKLCTLAGLNAQQKKLQDQLDKLDKAKNKDGAWRKKRNEIRKQLDAVKAAIRKAERYQDYAADEKEYEDSVDAAEKSRDQCIADSNRESADGWLETQTDELNEQVDGSLDAAIQLADDRRADVDEWYGETRDLILDAEAREKEAAQLDAEKLRRDEQRTARRLESRAQALLRNLGR